MPAALTSRPASSPPVQDSAVVTVKPRWIKSWATRTSGAYSFSYVSGKSFYSTETKSENEQIELEERNRTDTKFLDER